MAQETEQVTKRTSPVSGLVPMIPVADLERSIAFYRLLGFEVGNRVPQQGSIQWAWLYAPNAPDWRRGPNLMLNRSECTRTASDTAVVIYLYAPNLVELRD